MYYVCSEIKTKLGIMIPVKKEPKELFLEFGFYEKCKFCHKPTDTWHKKTNTHICKCCAKSHTVSDL